MMEIERRFKNGIICDCDKALMLRDEMWAMKAQIFVAAVWDCLQIAA